MKQQKFEALNFITTTCRKSAPRRNIYFELSKFVLEIILEILQKLNYICKASLRKDFCILLN